MSDNYLLSVIVASHRPGYIRACLDSLLTSFEALQGGKSRCQCIVVADYHSRELCNDYPNIQWHYLPSPSIPAKRNAGIKAAHADLCAFVDDDCQVAPDWAPQSLECMQLHPHWCGAEGKTSIDGTAHCSGHYKAYTRLESRGYRTNNIVYRSAWLRDIGGFDERFRFQHEDIDLALRLIDAGATIGFCETMRVAHRFRDDKWELLKNCLRRRFDPLLMKKHPQRYRCCRGSPIPPSIALLAAAHVIAAGISISSPALSVVACAADAAYITVCTRSRTGTFCIATLRFWREWLSYLISPVLLFAALAYGSIKFRKIVIF